MSRSKALRQVAVLVFMFALGTATTVADPGTGSFGYMWPTGLAAGVLALASQRATTTLVPTIVVLAAITFVLADYPVAVAIGYSVGIGLEALVAQQILTASRTRTWRMQDLSDLARFALACLVGSLVGAAMFSATAVINDFGSAWRIGIAVFVTHLAGQTILLGLFREPTGAEASYGWVERSVTWGLALIITFFSFLPDQLSSAAFLVIPLLGWVAFRARAREAMFLLVVIATISSTLANSGLGPFSAAFLNDLDPEFRYLPQQAFLLACAMVSIPFSVAVAMQRRSAYQLLQERARSDRLVQSARGIAIIGTDPIGRINLFSPGAESILGYTPDEVYGQSTRMFHTEVELARQAADLGCDPTYVSVVRATGELPPGTARVWQFTRKDGAVRTLSTILSPINDDNGDFVGYVATADDITDRIDAEAALEKALQTERRAVKRLIEIDQVKDQFVSSVSHELRTPITNIVGYLELMLDGVYGEPNEPQKDAMNRIDLNSRRLLTLIDDLLTLSSMESIDRRRRNSEIDLLTVLHRAAEIVGPSILQRDLELTFHLPETTVPVIGDAGELERLVINLATNAIKFTPDGGRIDIRLLPPTDCTGPVILVEDTGIGIREEDQDQLFTRFFRTPRAHELGVPGSGLGLSIAKAIADVHGATITARSVYGAGSTFQVEFPPNAPTAERVLVPPTNTASPANSMDPART